MIEISIYVACRDDMFSAKKQKKNEPEQAQARIQRNKIITLNQNITNTLMMYMLNMRYYSE